MRLALNFPRIDPTRGGAETYVVDLCRSLVRAGHQVDLYAETWKEGVAAAGGALRRRRRHRAAPAGRRSGASPATPKRRSARRTTTARSGSSTPGPRRDHPPGRRARAAAWRPTRSGSPRLVRAALRAGQDGSTPDLWLPGDRAAAVSPRERQARVVAVSHMVRRHIQQFHHVPRSRDPRRAQRHRPGPGQGRPARGRPLRVPQPAGPGAGRPGRPVRRAQLRAQGAEAAPAGPRGRASRGTRQAGRSTCSSAAAGASAAVPAHGQARSAWATTVHFLGFHPDIRECYASSDFFVLPTYYDPCSLVVLEALACGLPVITTAQNGAGELMTDGREGYVSPRPTPAAS